MEADITQQRWMVNVLGKSWKYVDSSVGQLHSQSISFGATLCNFTSLTDWLTKLRDVWSPLLQTDQQILCSCEIKSFINVTTNHTEVYSMFTNFLISACSPVLFNPLEPALIQIIFTNSVRTSKKTQHFTVTKINRLMLFKETLFISTITPNPTRLCGQSSLLNHEVLHTATYSWALKGWMPYIT